MIEIFIRKKQLMKDDSMKNLTKSYLGKSRSNLITMEILSKVDKHKTLLAIPKEHTTDEWVVVVGYYAMYMSALSLLAKLGYKSKSHTATSVALEEFFVKSKMLEKAHFINFEKIRMKIVQFRTYSVFSYFHHFFLLRMFCKVHHTFQLTFYSFLLLF